MRYVRRVKKRREKEKGPDFFAGYVYHRPGGGGTRRKIGKLGRGVRPASQNPYPIYHQNLRFSLPYL